jgi:hypothetical protein
VFCPFISWDASSLKSDISYLDDFIPGFKPALSAGKSL